MSDMLYMLMKSVKNLSCWLLIWIVTAGSAAACAVAAYGGLYFALKGGQGGDLAEVIPDGLIAAMPDEVQGMAQGQPPPMTNEEAAAYAALPLYQMADYRFDRSWDQQEDDPTFGRVRRYGFDLQWEQGARAAKDFPQQVAAYIDVHYPMKRTGIRALSRDQLRGREPMPPPLPSSEALLNRMTDQEVAEARFMATGVVSLPDAIDSRSNVRLIEGEPSSSIMLPPDTEVWIYEDSSLRSKSGSPVYQLVYEGMNDIRVFLTVGEFVRPFVDEIRYGQANPIPGFPGSYRVPHEAQTAMIDGVLHRSNEVGELAYIRVSGPGGQIRELGVMAWSSPNTWQDLSIDVSTLIRDFARLRWEYRDNGITNARWIYRTNNVID